MKSAIAALLLCKFASHGVLGHCWPQSNLCMLTDLCPAGWVNMGDDCQYMNPYMNSNFLGKNMRCCDYSGHQLKNKNGYCANLNSRRFEHDGAEIVLQDCDGQYEPAQRWEMDELGRIVSGGNDAMCIDPGNPSEPLNAKVLSRPCRTDANWQRWAFTKDGRLQNQGHPAYYLGVSSEFNSWIG